MVCVMIFLFSGTLRGCTTTVPSRRPRGKHIAEHKDIFLAMEGDLVKTPDTNAMTASSMSKCGGNGVGIKQRFSIEDLLGSNRDKRKNLAAAPVQPNIVQDLEDDDDVDDDDDDVLDVGDSSDFSGGRTLVPPMPTLIRPTPVVPGAAPPPRSSSSSLSLPTVPVPPCPPSSAPMLPSPPLLPPPPLQQQQPDPAAGVSPPPPPTSPSSSSSSEAASASAQYHHLLYSQWLATR